MRAEATDDGAEAPATAGQVPEAPSPATACRRLVAAITMLFAASCTAATAIPTQPPSVTISRLADDAAGVRSVAALELLAAYHLRSPDPRFGGFSAIETDGRTLWLLSDRAFLWHAAMTVDGRTGDLALEGWTVGAILRDAADRQSLDSEALALAPDGTLLAAFEHDDSVRRLVPEASGDWSTVRLHDGRLIGDAPANQGLESLARLPDGSLLALSEGARVAPDIAAGARLGDGGIERFGYRVAPDFSPVGAAATSDHLYVLERAVGVLTGWRSRLTLTRLPAPPLAGTLEGEELLRITAGSLAENYEGVAVLERPGEHALILLVADDNQSPLQRTLLLVFSYTG